MVSAPTEGDRFLNGEPGVFRLRGRNSFHRQILVLWRVEGGGGDGGGGAGKGVGARSDVSHAWPLIPRLNSTVQCYWVFVECAESRISTLFAPIK